MLRLLIEHDTDGKIKPTLINNLGSSVIQHNAITVAKLICQVRDIQVRI